MTQEKRILSFVKRKGRKISDYKEALVRKLLPQIEIKSLSDDAVLETLKNIKDKAVNLEIGYGGGEHLAMQAELYKDQIFVGCEPFFNGTAKLLTSIEERSLDNIFIYQNDALLLLEEFPDNFFEKIFILFPDPWPKKRHNKRRIINDNNIKIFCDKLKDGGLLRLATDHSDYASWMIAKLIKHEALSWQAKEIRDWYSEPNDWVKTKYQRKALAGETYFFYDFLNIPRNSDKL